MQDKTKKPNVWDAHVRVPYKKILAFELLFMVLGMFMGAGIITAILDG